MSEINPTPTHTTPDHLSASIMVLLVLTSVMLAALFTRTPPHPPLEVPLFALAPFLGASLAIGFAALWLARRGAGVRLALVFAVTALVSFGPQKYFDPAFLRIWPAVLLAQAAIAVLAYCAFKTLRAKTASA